MKKGLKKIPVIKKKSKHKGNHGQSNILIIILLILLTLATIIILWNFLRPLIINSLNDAKINIFLNQIKIDKVNLSDDPNYVSIKRLSGEDNITALNFIFYDSDGNSFIIKKTDNIPAVVLEIKNSYFTPYELANVTGKILSKITVIPVFNKKMGIEYSTDKIIDNRNLILNPGAEFASTYGWTIGVTNETLISNTNHSGNYSFYTIGKGAFSSSYFEISPNVNYSIEGFFKSIGSGGNSKLFFGFSTYDKDKKQIGHTNVFYRILSNTTLAQPCLATDTSVVVTSCNNWISSTVDYIAFNIDDSGNYYDIPNFNISQGTVSSLTGSSPCTISLNGPVGVNAAAGTKIREHFNGYSWTYFVEDLPVPASWTKYNATIYGVSNGGPSDMNQINKWRKGTKYAKVFIGVNYDQSINYIMNFDDIKVLKLTN